MLDFTIIKKVQTATTMEDYQIGKLYKVPQYQILVRMQKRLRHYCQLLQL